MNNQIQNTALIAGATGQIGRSISRCLLESKRWKVIGLARRSADHTEYPMIGVDLTHREDCLSKLSTQRHITHLVYAARYDHFGGAQEAVDTNIMMLQNLIDAVLPVADNLKHIHLVHGTKYYGHTKAQRPVPYKEDDACGNFDSFYYTQQELIKRLQTGKTWTWSISRPHAFCDHNINESRNLLLLVGIYASVMRECGLPLIFPGTIQSYHSKTQFSWLPTLARSVAWMMTEPQCANQAFNIVNGDSPTWAELWPALAAYFAIQPGEPANTRFETLLADKQAVWQMLCARYGLKPSQLQTAVQWPYGDYALSCQWDVVSSMTKATQAGFTERVDSFKMWRAGFDFYRAQKLIP
jgi:nucleoside-diphosphate-sugar epimerase